MFQLDRLRNRQEQRLSIALESFDEAKKHLEDAIALAETREREYHEVEEDVRRRLEAVDLVMSMAREIGDGMPEERVLRAAEKQPMLMPPDKGSREIEQAPGSPTLLHSTSRPLFPSSVRSKYARLSILQ